MDSNTNSSQQPPPGEDLNSQLNQILRIHTLAWPGSSSSICMHVVFVRSYHVVIAWLQFVLNEYITNTHICRLPEAGR
jgi:hypothetical protein